MDQEVRVVSEHGDSPCEARSPSAELPNIAQPTFTNVQRRVTVREDIRTTMGGSQFDRELYRNHTKKRGMFSCCCGVFFLCVFAMLERLVSQILKTPIKQSVKDFTLSTSNRERLSSVPHLRLELLRKWQLYTIWVLVTLCLPALMISVRTWEAHNTWRPTDICTGSPIVLPASDAGLGGGNWTSDKCLSQTYDTFGNMTSATWSGISRCPDCEVTPARYAMQLLVKFQLRNITARSMEHFSSPVNFRIVGTESLTSTTKHVFAQPLSTYCVDLECDWCLLVSKRSQLPFNVKYINITAIAPEATMEAIDWEATQVAVLFENTYFSILSVTIRGGFIIIDILMLIYYLGVWITAEKQHKNIVQSCASLQENGTDKVADLVHFSAVHAAQEHIIEASRLLPEQKLVCVFLVLLPLYCNPLYLAVENNPNPSPSLVLFFEIMENHIGYAFQNLIIACIAVLFMCVQQGTLKPRLYKMPSVIVAIFWFLIVTSLEVLSQVFDEATISDGDKFVDFTFTSRRIFLDVGRMILYGLWGVHLIRGFVLSRRFVRSTPYLMNRSRALLYVSITWLITPFVAMFGIIVVAFSIWRPDIYSSSSFTTVATKIGNLCASCTFVLVYSYCLSPTPEVAWRILFGRAAKEGRPPLPHDRHWTCVPWRKEWVEMFHELQVYHKYFFFEESERCALVKANSLPGGVPHAKEAHNSTPLIGSNEDTNKSELFELFSLQLACELLNLATEVYYEDPSTYHHQRFARRNQGFPNSRSDLDVSTKEGNVSPPLSDGPTKRHRSATVMPSRINAKDLRAINVQRFMYNLHDVITKESNQAMICTAWEKDAFQRPKIVIAFRGTSNVENIKSDINILRKPLPPFRDLPWNAVEAAAERLSVTGVFNCQIHRGFMRAYLQIRPRVLQSLQELLRKLHCVRSEDVIVHITGHSLGGALATIAAYDITQQIFTVGDITLNLAPVVYTYGSPRVGNLHFQHMYNRAVPETYRIKNEGDFVTSVPFSIGFRHVGRLVLIDRSGSLIIQPTTAEALLQPGRTARTSHMCETYAVSLRAVCRHLDLVHTCAVTNPKALPYLIDNGYSVLGGAAQKAAVAGIQQDVQWIPVEILTRDDIEDEPTENFRYSMFDVRTDDAL